jgi:hypothetical protein
MTNMTPSATATPIATASDGAPASLTRTARATGLSYLGVAITGVLGFILIRESLYVDGDPAATAANLVDNATRARIGIGIDLALVITQTMAALWFYRLFRHVDSFAAASLAALGIVNAVAIMIATAFSATALATAVGDTPAPGDDSAANAQLLYDLNEAIWSVAGIFFGLWLIPMGYLVLKSRTMPRTLGIVIIAGGIGYIVATYVGFLFPDAASTADSLTWVAAIGEFWIIGYLLTIGLRAPNDPKSMPRLHE